MPGQDFALNHMVAPRKSLPAFVDMARSLGVDQIEIRNDLAGQAITDGTPPEKVRAEVEQAGLSIVSINALQRFNQWTPARAEEAAELVAYAQACGAKALVLCPVNDESFRPPDKERLAGLREALTALKPMLRQAGIVGLVEPLGFAECSLRFKREAVDAIAAVGGTDTFKLVHDTFHHHVAGETEIFPASTGLVHISGVIDPAVSADRMRDPHRMLVDAQDLLDNVGQVRALRAGGYRGPISFEPFSSDVHDLADSEGAIRASMEFMSAGLGRPAP